MDCGEWQLLHEPLEDYHNSVRARARARRNIRSERHARYLATAVPQQTMKSKPQGENYGDRVGAKSQIYIQMLVIFVPAFPLLNLAGNCLVRIE